MSAVQVDLYLEIGWNSLKDIYSLKNTNIKRTREAFEEVLEPYVHDQFLRGIDERKPEKREEYFVKIGVALEDDTFYIESNTGSRTLNMNIVMGFLNNLEGILNGTNLT